MRPQVGPVACNNIHRGAIMATPDVDAICANCDGDGTLDAGDLACFLDRYSRVVGGAP